jgi:nucleoside-diphosphate-sugar epimerase
VSARHALVAGVTGLVGRRIAAHLHDTGWKVTGLCRRLPAQALPFATRSVDLTNARDCCEKLADLDSVTHVFYAARYDHPEGASESIDVNASMLTNLIDAIEPVAERLQHVHLVHGTKYYGHMLGPPKALPFTEETPRAPVPNFYFAHEDFIRARQAGKGWTWSTSRPHTFCDDAADEPRNAALLIAVHAVLARELDLPLVYPGTQESFEARTQFTYVPMLARASAWMALTPACANQSYNIVNGDSPRWCELWPVVADYFGVECGAAVSVRLGDYVADKKTTWDEVVRRFDLEPVSLSERVLWPYADYLFAPEWDIISASAKARRDGFNESVNSAQMFLGLFDRFRNDKIIP